MQFDISYTWEAMPALLQGAVITLQFSVTTLFFSILLATAVSIIRATGLWLAELLVSLYVSFIRGTPLLVQIFLVYYVLPFIGIDLHPVTAGIVALTINSAAIVSEIIRGGLSAIPKGQIEAAQSLGLKSRIIWLRVTLPQVFIMIIPPLVNEFTLVVKSTTLVSLITVVEMMRTAQQIFSANFRPIEVLLGAAVLYFIINFTVSKLAAHVERRNAVRLA